jgi:hypothetical protein
VGGSKRSLKESEEHSSGGIFPCENFGDRPRRSVNKIEAWKQEEFSRGRESMT